MNQMKLLKSGNSKNDLVKAILMYQKALAYYMNEAHWVKGYEGTYKWNHPDDKDPTKVAKLVLGVKENDVRQPDKNVDDSIHLQGGK